jgi:site-specific recombinase XerD
MDPESKAIIANEGPGSTALALEPDLAEAIRRVIAAAESQNTRRAYATQFAKFEAWCARRCTSALPATPAVVAIYLTDLAATGADPSKPAKGAKVATVSLAFSAISAAHRTAALNLDTKAREIRLAMKGIRKDYSKAQTQAQALKPETVRGILSALNTSDHAVDRSDAALIALLFAAALRRSEIVGLDYGQTGYGNGYMRPWRSFSCAPKRELSPSPSRSRGSITLGCLRRSSAG